MKKLLLLALGLVMAGGSLSAQHPTFEVATIKQNKEGGPFRIFFQPGGRFVANNVTLKMLIAAAYGTPQPLPDFQIDGGPKWIGTDRFDVTAKAAGDPAPGPNGPPPTMFLMLQSMLEERFKLKVHYEIRDTPIFQLVLLRPDGKLGAQVHPSAVDCAALMASMRAAGGPPAPPPPGQRLQCGARMFPGNLSAGAMTMAQIVNGLARTPGINRQVVDKTGLTGVFDFDLTYTPDQMPQGERPPDAPPLPPIDPNAPSLFTAIQEQWGMKLEATKAPVNMLIIDSAGTLVED